MCNNSRYKTCAWYRTEHQTVASYKYEHIILLPATPCPQPAHQTTNHNLPTFLGVLLSFVRQRPPSSLAIVAKSSSFICSVASPGSIPMLPVSTESSCPLLLLGHNSSYYYRSWISNVYLCSPITGWWEVPICLVLQFNMSNVIRLWMNYCQTSDKAMPFRFFLLTVVCISGLSGKVSAKRNEDHGRVLGRFWRRRYWW